MGQKRDGKFLVREPQGGGFSATTSPMVADIFEKAPQEQAVGQATPQVGSDLVRSVVSDKSGLQQENADPELRMAADIFDSELAKSLALESSKTKYGPGQISKSPGVGSYLGEASYPAGPTS
tara:strand:+ start:3445 stop:3810 length:366 start_codon:yes stop_codon:yes gene_type:complete